MMRQTLSLVLLALVLVPLAGTAQPNPPPPPAMVAGFLGFTEDQAAQFVKMFGTLQGTLTGLEQQMQAQQQELGRLASAAAPDPVAVGQTFLKLVALQRQAGQAVDAYHQQFATLLNDEQKQKVQAVNQAAQLLPLVQAFVAVKLAGPPPPPPQQ
jgi:Spy/CpxP family protein refolding chaperone